MNERKIIMKRMRKVRENIKQHTASLLQAKNMVEANLIVMDLYAFYRAETRLTEDYMATFLGVKRNDL